MEHDTTDAIPAAEYERAERIARAYITDNYPAYKDRITSIGGSPRGKFLMVYISLGPDEHSHRTGPRAPLSYGRPTPLLPLQKATPKPRSKRVKPLLIRKC